MLFALNFNFAAMSFVDLLKLIIIVAGCCGVCYIIVKVCGWTIPWWLIQIAIIVVACFVGIVAINILASM